MRIQVSTSIMTLLCACALLPAQVPDYGAAAQAPAGLPPAQSAPAKPTPQTTAAAVTPSTMLQPSLDHVQQTLGSLRLEKWKRGNIRDEASDNIHQIQRDIQDNLPALVQDADRDPASLSKLLTLSRNVDALYDVLLRVEEASRVVAPGEQVESIEKALERLSSARRSLDGRMLDAAKATEKQVVDLRTTVQKQAAFKCPAPPPPVVKPCPTPPHRARKRRPARKPAAEGSQKPGQSNQKPPTPNQKPKQGNAPSQSGP